MTRIRFHYLSVLLAAALASVAGCSGIGAAKPTARQLAPSDFHDNARPAAPVVGQPAIKAASPPVATTTPVAATAPTATAPTATTAPPAGPAAPATAPPAAQTTPPDTAPPSTAPATVSPDNAAPGGDNNPAAPGANGEQAFTVGAMVGQVNGKPLYASEVFEPIDEQLRALGKRQPRLVFRDTALEQIRARLNEILYVTLILGEAERDLVPQEQEGLKVVLKRKREEFLRQYGQGSEAVADATLRRTHGKSLEEMLEDERQRLVVQRYIGKKVYVKINITRKDVENYYEEHYKEFNPPPGRTLRLIKISNNDNASADRIDKALGEGKPFAEVAADAANAFRASDGGLFPEKAQGDKVFQQDALNEAMVTLKAGQHSPRLEVDGSFWWVFVEAIENGEGRPLRKVQLEIFDRMRLLQMQMLTQRYRQDLYRNGSYTPVDQMVAALLEVAMSRYAGPN